MNQTTMISTLYNDVIESKDDTMFNNAYNELCSYILNPDKINIDNNGCIFDNISNDNIEDIIKFIDSDNLINICTINKRFLNISKKYIYNTIQLEFNRNNNDYELTIGNNYCKIFT